MQEDLISFETAKLAKEKKFNIPCENFYIEYIDDDVADLFNYEEQRGSGYAELYRNNQEFKYSASTQSLLQKWLREVHNIHLVVWWRDQEDMFYCEMGSKSGGMIIIQSGDGTKLYKTYEEALEAGLQEALKLLNN